MTDTIGQQLKQARQARRITLEKASEVTHIRLYFLQALEADDYSAMSSAAQARGFLHNYCAYLELDLDEMLAAVQQTRFAHPDEIHGPLPQVEISPIPPEPATRPVPNKPVLPEIETSAVERDSWVARLREAVLRLRSAPARVAQLPAEPPQERTQDVPTRPLPEAAAAPIPHIPDEAPAKKASPPGDEKAVQVEQEQPADPPPSTIVETSEPPEQAAAQPSLIQRIKTFFASRLSTQKAPEVLEEEQPLSNTGLPPEPASEPIPESPLDTEPGENAEQIFIEIGRELRMRRELLSLTHEEVERHIRVRAVFVDALERGDFVQLPSAVQTRGMLANYAEFLDLDTDALLLRFADALQASHRVRHPRLPGSSRQPLAVKPSLPPLRSFVASDLVFGLAVVIMVVALIAWGMGRLFDEQAAPVALPTAPSISDVLAGTSVPGPIQEVTLIPIEDTPLVVDTNPTMPEPTEEVPAFDPETPVNVTVVATERTFMRVLVDGEEIFNGRVTPGVAYTYAGTATIQILAGNGAALRVTYNGRDLGLLGSFGEVVEFIYTASEIVTPLPAASPTPTASPALSPTPSPTQSLTPTLKSP